MEMLLDILQHPHLKPAAPHPLLSLVVTVTWHLGRLKSDAEATSVAENLSQSLRFALPTVTDARPQRKDEDLELDASSKTEKVAQLQRRTWRLLSELDPQKEVTVVDHSSGEKLAVQDAVVRLQSCLCQQH